ncbi:hypothetical protein FOE78_19425 [Microlunatus elymi]|uniref:DUF4037 domain-containing protein n=1 Tax=Microlunatus elymi TaxID=2596828 RepID=A0A516Q3K4_9ACTN|nr:hypothetical protein [Microlunatus elymi]QDP97791.1 hypothetical protein FOE78_19425 [Microlunatus elymi]
MVTAAGFLTPDRLRHWRLWPALVERDDLAMLHRACSDVTDVLLGTLCAVNRIYIEHPPFKWSRQLADRFTRAPADFGDRLFAALGTGPAQGAPGLHALLADTVRIVASELPKVDTSTIYDSLNCRR